ncbi:hypothetical protein HMPREF1033_03208, partial [Tannerella sp. 6_1_58FAA_CT1]
NKNETLRFAVRFTNEKRQAILEEITIDKKVVRDE